jgi:hypothetical protein
MSGSPVRPRPRELEIVRVLFDKHLLERAVNLSEARWAGSGDMVRLAYRWRDMGPAERRQELERIGPEQLAQFRALADLDPELANVLNTLEERGVLPPRPAAAEHDDDSPRQEEEVAVERPRRADPVPNKTIDRGGPVETDPGDHLPPTGGSGWVPDVSADVGKLFDGEMAVLNLDRESLADFAAREKSRQSEAVASGEELLKRVRARLDSSARRVTSNPPGSGSTSSSLPARMSSAMTGRTGSAAVITSDEEAQFVPPPGYWLKRLKDERIIVVDSSMKAPSDDDLVALANEFGLGLSEFAIDAGMTRQLFGGLKRNGARVDVQVGPLPSALAEPSLVVVRGRLMQRIEDRMRLGMCDIPGTRATVRIDPQTRILLISQ